MPLTLLAMAYLRCDGGGASTTFSVQFSAASAGNNSGTVAFATNDPNNTTFSFTLAVTV